MASAPRRPGLVRNSPADCSVVVWTVAVAAAFEDLAKNRAVAFAARASSQPVSAMARGCRNIGVVWRV